MLDARIYRTGLVVVALAVVVLAFSLTLESADIGATQRLTVFRTLYFK